MAVKMITTNIGGAKWEMNTLPATTGLSCLTQIAAIVGAPAGAAASAAKGKEKLMDLDVSIMGDAVAKMTERLAEPGTIDLVKTLLTDVRRNDKKIDFDDYFASNYSDLPSLIGWSLKENFGSFLAGNALLAALAEKAQTSIRATSTGGSGE